ncbi:MAG: sulfite exporter TauE/SafE family protein [Myxococcota bacterium]|nr:sulfite exporter TauE/SafE family protein [Myxococcota bacterium]
MLDLFSVVSPTTFALLGITGLVAGFINTVAGGGSLLTMPAMIFLGIPPTSANGSLRPAILFQNIIACWKYRQEGLIPWRQVGPMLPPVLVGTALGAGITAQISNENTKLILGASLIISLSFILLPARPITQSKPENSTWRRVGKPLTLLTVGLYGGAIQAGVGYLILGTLKRLFNLPLREANIIKVVLVLVYTPLAIIFFAKEGQIVLWASVTLALSQGIGAWLGATFNLKGSERWLRGLVATFIVFSILKILFF